MSLHGHANEHESSSLASGTEANVTMSEEPSSGLGLAMAKVGDRWALLIVDALLAGPRRWKDLESLVPGVAPNILSARLRRLERDGLVVAERYSDRPVRYQYRVSVDGRELAGALRLLESWGARAAGELSPGPRHSACGTNLEARWYCPTCQRVVDQPDEGVTWL